jgi:hypothetical protein
MNTMDTMNQFKQLEIKTIIQKLIDELNTSLKTISLIEVKLNDSLQYVEKKPLVNSVISTAKEWLNSWKKNNNTGRNVEIRVGLELLLSSKLETRESIPELIEEYSIPEKFNIYPNQNVSKKVIGILNLTQDDNDCGTSDIALVYQDGTRSNYSVTEGKDKLTKCIRNPSPKETYNIQKHIEYLKKKKEKVYNDIIKFATEKYGVPSKKWKGNKYPQVALFVEELARIASEEWNLFTFHEKKEHLLKMFDLNVFLKTKSDGIIFFDKKTKKIHCIYTWKLKINLDQCMKTRYNKGYIYHYLDNKPNEILIKTQAKYNNGVIEGLSDKSGWKLKSGNPFTSWNCVAMLENIFDMKKMKYL